MCHILEGSQAEHTSSSPMASTEANSENAGPGALPSPILYHLLMQVFLLVDSPTTCQFVGGHVAHASGLRPFSKSFDLKGIAHAHHISRSRSVSDTLCLSLPTLQIHLGSLD